MNNKDFDDYRFANISEEDIQYITKLENELSIKENKEIVLVAYESNKKPLDL